jgi:hypothetical protein
MNFLEIAIWFIVILFVFVIPFYLIYKIIFHYRSSFIKKALYIFLVFTPVLGIVFYFFYTSEKNTKINRLDKKSSYTNGI